MPLLLTHCAGNFGELLLPGKTGFEIADPADPSSALMQALTTPPERIAQMGEASFENAKANFDTELVANNLINQLIAL